MWHSGSCQSIKYSLGTRTCSYLRNLPELFQFCDTPDLTQDLMYAKHIVYHQALSPAGLPFRTFSVCIWIDTCFCMCTQVASLERGLFGTCCPPACFYLAVWISHLLLQRLCLSVVRWVPATLAKGPQVDMNTSLPPQQWLLCLRLIYPSVEILLLRTPKCVSGSGFSGSVDGFCFCFYEARSCCVALAGLVLSRQPSVISNATPSLPQLPWS